MKRAEIAFKYGAWILTPFSTHDYKESSVRIRDRKPHGGVAYSFPTHAAALAHALDAVGLDPTDSITRTYRDHYAKDQS